MSALNFARQAFSREKPHSSITDWVDLLTASNIAEEAYDGIPELVDSINLQASGTTEASRALRKKLKHGNPHQQYRSLVILKALVENCGPKFQSSFADSQLVIAIKSIASDPHVDKRVKKKLLLVLRSWEDHYKDDPSMSLIANLYKEYKTEGSSTNYDYMRHLAGDAPLVEDKRKAEAKRRAQEEREARERAIREERERERNRNRTKRVPFNFEKDKPKVMASIVEASQASSNLVNAITLVNPENDSVLVNERVQDCVAKAKQARKAIVRYIQLVENEEIIGTLIETNEHVNSALELYERKSALDPSSTADDGDVIAAGMAAANINEPESPVSRQKNPEQLSDVRNGKDMNYVHPDLQDLSFGPLGISLTNLPPPLRPSALSDDRAGQDDHAYDGHGTLSDYSDYESSDEGTHKNPESSRRKNYVTVSDDDDEVALPIGKSSKVTSGQGEDDPFADPFAGLGQSSK